MGTLTGETLLRSNQAIRNLVPPAYTELMNSLDLEVGAQLLKARDAKCQVDKMMCDILPIMISNKMQANFLHVARRVFPQEVLIDLGMVVTNILEFERCVLWEERKLLRVLNRANMKRLQIFVTNWQRRFRIMRSKYPKIRVLSLVCYFIMPTSIRKLILWRLKNEKEFIHWQRQRSSACHEAMAVLQRKLTRQHQLQFKDNTALFGNPISLSKYLRRIQLELLEKVNPCLV